MNSQPYREGRTERQNTTAIQKSKLNRIIYHLKLITAFRLFQRLNVFSYFRGRYDDG
jgi:hypothetical protein